MSTVPQRLGKYQFQQFLGKGNVGEVWKAHDLSNRRVVALKKVYTDLQRSDPQFLTRFMTDGQILVTLHHENLVPILEVNVTRQEQSNEITAYLATKYIVGQTFASYLQNTSHQSNFPALSAIINFFTSLGRALDYAYERGVVHGNLTPDNILLDQQDTSHFPGGEPMLTDIGLTQILGSATNTYTKAPFYFSPEQAQGYPPSHRSDVYSLGVILYEVYTGTVPFRGESSTTIISQHIHTLPTPPALINPVVPPALSEVILRAIAKDPITRFPTVSAFAAAIADANTIQSSASLSEQLSREDVSTASQPAVRLENSLLGVAQPPPLPGSSRFRLSGGLSPDGLTPREIPTHTLTIPPRLSPLPLQVQPVTPDALLSEANETVQSPEPQQPIALQGQTQQLLPRTPEPAEPKKLDEQTQAISEFAIAQTPQTYTPHPDADVSQPVSTRDWQQNQPVFSADFAVPSPVPVRPVSHMPPGPQQTSLSQSQWQAQPPPMLAQPQRREGKKTSLYIALIALLILVVIGGTLGAFFLFNKTNVNTIASGNSSNRVFFQDGTLHNDQLRIDMQNVATPPSGQTYFAWLEDTALQTQPLGALSVHNGSVAFLYQGDGKHTNLISLVRGILITTEDIGKTPSKPSAHKVYQAFFDAQLLDGLKYLLYATPGLPGQQSIMATILDTLHSIDDKAGSIADTLNHDNDQAMRQATRIIEMLDNSQQARSSGDLPTKYPSQVNVPIGLLSSSSQQGYLDLLDEQLKQLEPVVARDANAQRHLTNIKSALGDLRDWLQKMRDYDVQLLKAADLQDPGIAGSALQLKQVSADCFTGRTIPPNASPQPIAGSAGARQAYTEAQYMATLYLQPVA